MNDGFVNEKDIIEYLNEKKFNQLNINFQKFLKFIFKDYLDENLSFKAKKCPGGIKPDIVISHNGISKYISIKKGSGNSVHQERIDVFFPYFKSITDEHSLNNLKKFHYGDDTIDDTGLTRYSASQAKSKYKNEINQLNKIINTDNNLINFLDRFLFIGNMAETKVDYLYHGTINKGYWASREEIIRFILGKEFNINGVHFGPLTYQVWGRNHNRTAKYPDRRYVMQVKWQSVLDNLKTIRKENDLDI